MRQLFKNFEDYCLPKKDLVVERTKFIGKNQNDYETFDQYITELKNFIGTCEYAELRDSLLIYNIVDQIISEKVRDVLLRKGTEMTLEKAINICRTDEITKRQMKEMRIDKEVNGIFLNKLWKPSKQKNQVEESDKVVKSDQKSA